MYQRPLIRKVICELERFSSIVHPTEFNRRGWTAGVKNALRITGIHFDCQVNTCIEADCLPCELEAEYQAPHYGEWLYDVSLCDVGEGNNWQMAAVAECEWDNDQEVKMDFEKLMIARACLRVMVYRASKVEADQLCKWVNLYEGSRVGDTYLLVAHRGWEGGNSCFQYRQIVVRSPNAALMETTQG